MDLKGKIIFITGAAKGLGKAYSEELLGKGAKIFIGDVNAEGGQATVRELGEKFGKDNVKFGVLDVTNHKNFEDVFKQAVSEFGHIDIMVNNAGIFDESRWVFATEVNFISVVKGTEIAIAHMRKDKGGRGGRIINVSSIAGLYDFPTTPIYCGAKHAVRSYTTSLSLQPNLDELGIEFGIMCPGPTATDLLLKADKSMVNFYEILAERWKETMMPIPHTVAGFMKLIQLRKLNGAMLFVQKSGITFQKMETRAIEWDE